MSSPTELLPGTSIAATSWLTGSSPHLRVYFQDIHGGIRESRWDGTWSGGTANDVIVKAKFNSDIAVFNYGVASIRVYYINNDDIIQEICQDNGGQWFAGALNAAKVKASPVSRLTVIGRTWNDTAITVYYQRTDETIGEIKQDNSGWSQGAAILIDNKPVRSVLKTGLAAVAYKTTSETGIRVYYQAVDGSLVEAGINEGGKWFKGAFPKVDSAAPAGNIAAFQHGVDNPFLQVYFLGKPNNTIQYGYYSQAWHGPNHPGQTTTSPGSGIAVIPAESPAALHLFVQDETNRIQEWILAGNNWNKGAFVPVGGLQASS